MDFTSSLVPDPHDEDNRNVRDTQLSDAALKDVEETGQVIDDPFCWLSNFESSSAAHDDLEEVIDAHRGYSKHAGMCGGEMNDDIVAAPGCIFSTSLPEMYGNPDVVKTSIAEPPLDENALPIHGTQECGVELDAVDIPPDDAISAADVSNTSSDVYVKETFFCPPPAIHLRGSGWRSKRNKEKGSAADDIRLYMNISGYQVQRTPIDGCNQGCTTAKNFYIPDSDKRKHFEIHAKMFSKDGKEIASFATKPIKVISKPSKKKQSVKNNELCITSNSKVALFNRLRSQTMSTRYLYTDQKQYNSSLTRWRSFLIHIVDNDQEESEEFQVEDGCIYYGMCIKLVCPVNNLASPLLIIRKVDKQMAVTTSDEPVSQLHKCALQLKGTSCHYLVLDRDQIVVNEAPAPPDHPQNHRLCEGSCWTIISTDQCEFTWNDRLFPTDSLITPVPKVTDMEFNKDGDRVTARLVGYNFSDKLTVWFGDVKVKSKFENAKLMICSVPKVDRLTLGSAEQEVNLPLLFIRDDGVIYPSGITIQLSGR